MELILPSKCLHDDGEEVIRDVERAERYSNFAHRDETFSAEYWIATFCEVISDADITDGE